jgi:diguanylate cyclase (GGDEF)-like protein
MHVMSAWKAIESWACPPAPIGQEHSIKELQRVLHARNLLYMAPFGIFCDIIATYTVSILPELLLLACIIIMPVLALYLSHKSFTSSAISVYLGIQTAFTAVLLFDPVMLTPSNKIFMAVGFTIYITSLLLNTGTVLIVMSALVLVQGIVNIHDKQSFTSGIGSISGIILFAAITCLGSRSLWQLLHDADRTDELNNLNQELHEIIDETEKLLAEMGGVFENLDVGLIVYDSNGNELHRNEADRRILDVAYSAQEHALERANSFILCALNGTPILPEDYPVPRLLITHESAPEKIFQLKLANHAIRYVKAQAVPLYRGNHELIGVLGITQDITTNYLHERNIELMSEIAHACASAVDCKSVAKAAIDTILDGLHIPSGYIIVPDTERPDYGHILYIRLDPYKYDEKITKQIVTQIEQTPISNEAPYGSLQVLASKEPIFDFQSPIKMDVGGNAFGFSNYVPLITHDQIIGVLCLLYDTATSQHWEKLNRELLLLLADEIAMSMQRAQLYEEAHRLAMYDPLTGLFNHRALQQLLQQHIANAQNNKQIFSVIMLDVDHFRRFNETYGHDVGDMALRAVAHAICSVIRKDDVAARYGGEEFTVILPNTTHETAHEIAGRIRMAIAEEKLTIQSTAEISTLTASLGYALYPSDAISGQQLLKAADIALYASKHHGRNRVTSFIATPEGIERQLVDLKMMTLDSIPQVTKGASLETVQALIAAIELRDGFTRQHSEKVAHYATALATELHFRPDEIEQLRLGCLIHDVGKIGISDSILCKPGALTSEEQEIMCKHTILGEQLVSAVEDLHSLLPLIRSHHERLDGSGYPDGLKGDEISALVRILTIADIYEACTTFRPYHAARTMAEGITLLSDEASSGKLDAEYVKAFIALLLKTDGLPIETSVNIAA